MGGSYWMISDNLIPVRKRIAIIQNPVSGGSPRCLEKILRILEALKVDFQVMRTQRAGDGLELARRIATEQGWDAVVAAGGDGTCNEVASGILGGAIPMGVIPTGTANVLAAEIGMGMTPESIAHTLAFGEVRSVCVGQMNDRIFLLMVGSGWDARVVAGVSPRLKKSLGRWAYAVQAVKQIWKVPSSPLQIFLENKMEEGDWAIVCNAGHYGGKYMIAPQARMEDPSFRVLIFNGQGPLDRIKDLSTLWLGRSGLSKKIRVFATDKVRITGGSAELIQVDGDPAGILPVEISIAPHRLNLIVPLSRT
jgi:diacylglycerol kinase (ATP)